MPPRWYVFLIYILALVNDGVFLQPESADDEPPPFALPVAVPGQGGLVNSAAGAAGALAGWAITSLGRKVSIISLIPQKLLTVI